MNAEHELGTQPLHPTISVMSGANARKRRYGELLLGVFFLSDGMMRISSAHTVSGGVRGFGPVLHNAFVIFLPQAIEPRQDHDAGLVGIAKPPVATPWWNCSMTMLIKGWGAIRMGPHT